MHTIWKDFSFAAAHSIRGHTRGCENLHGHNYRVRVHLRASRLDRLGMVLDFADLKAIMQEVLGPFDHRVLNDVPPFDRRNTTAELLAQHVFDEVAKRLPAAAAGSGGPRTGVEAEGAEAGGRKAGRREPGVQEAGEQAPGGQGAGGQEAGGRRISVVRVEVWENDSSCAAYEP